MNIGKAFQTIREEAGLTRKDLAEKLDCTPNSLWKIENKRVWPKEATIIRLCFVTRTPLARFYTLALEARDFAPYPSVKDCCTCMRESGVFSQEELENYTSRLLKYKVEE